MDKSNYITRYYKIIAGYGTKKHKEEALAYPIDQGFSPYGKPYAFYYVAVSINTNKYCYNDSLRRKIFRYISSYFAQGLMLLSVYVIYDITDIYYDMKSTGKPLSKITLG